MDYFRQMKNLVIRDAKSSDLPVLLSFEQKLIEAERPYDVTIKKTKVSYYDIEAYIKDKEVKVLVAEFENQIVSSGYALKKKSSGFLNHSVYGYLGFMYTINEFRGRGINKRIVEALKEWCLASGLNEIRLKVYSENYSAIKAYEKTGFKPLLVEMRLNN